MTVGSVQRPEYPFREIWLKIGAMPIGSISGRQSDPAESARPAAFGVAELLVLFGRR